MMYLAASSSVNGWAKCGRILLQGSGCDKEELARGQIKYKKKSNEDIFKKLRWAGASVETALQRLRARQQVMADVDQYDHSRNNNQ